MVSKESLPQPFFMANEKDEAKEMLSKAKGKLNDLIKGVEEDNDIHTLLTLSLEAQSYLRKAKDQVLHHHLKNCVLDKSSIFTKKQKEEILEIYNVYV